MEDESIDGGLARIRQTDFSGEAAEFAHNKRAMFRILEENPKIGVYKNETFAEWEVFYQFFLNFLKS